MCKNVLIFSFALLFILQCKPDKRASISQLDGVYEINKDTLKALLLQDADNAIAQQLVALALGSTQN